MRILLDTNVFIILEDDAILEEHFGALLREASRHSEILIHPRSIEEIKRDRDEVRRGKTLSKIGKYSMLMSPPIPDRDFLQNFGDVISENDKVDAEMLFAVQRNSIDFLITEDKKIHRIAKNINIHERVLSVSQGGEFFKRLSKREIPSHTLVEYIPVYNLDPNDSFFDSLKGDYDFEEWFSKISRENRKCWVYRPDSKIKALCIIKEEEKPDSDKIPSPTLKICTFKVADDLGGKRIGELLLKMALQYTFKNKFKSTYFTIYPKQDHLISFMEDFGFETIDMKDNEKIMMKPIVPPSDTPKTMDPLDFGIKYYPNLDDSENVGKFIVPIRPNYHSRVFPDCLGRQSSLDEFSGIVPEGNTIKKAYICNAKTGQISKGDILLFYQSQDRKEITCVGMAEETLRSTNPDKITRLVGNRTIYTHQEIAKIAKSGALVIIFRHMRNLKEPITLSSIEATGIPGPFQSIRKIPHKKYLRLRGDGLK